MSQITRGSLTPLHTVPHGMQQLLVALGDIWSTAPERPQPPRAVESGWASLIDEWVHSDLPLIIRKSGGVRGAELTHHSGRRLVLADNSPAQWAFSRAMQQQVPRLEEIRSLLLQDRIPFAFAIKSSEKDMMQYRRTLSPDDNVNRRGWKLCHIERVGLAQRGSVNNFDLTTLTGHFRRLLDPANMFVVPLQWGGLGEVPEFIEAMRRSRTALF